MTKKEILEKAYKKIEDGQSSAPEVIDKILSESMDEFAISELEKVKETIKDYQGKCTSMTRLTAYSNCLSEINKEIENINRNAAPASAAKL